MFIFPALLETPKLFFRNELSDLICDQVRNDKAIIQSDGRGRILF